MWIVLIVIVILAAILIARQYHRTDQAWNSPADVGVVNVDNGNPSGSTNGGGTDKNGNALAGKPHITSLSPKSGRPGTKVTIYGTNFDPAQNSITFANYTEQHRPDGSRINIVVTEGSSDGKTLTFIVPTKTPGGIVCNTKNECRTESPTNYAAGNYPVSVVTKNGVSNLIDFTISN